MSVRTRYAPSPTGSPHVGNLRTAIYCWLLARKEGGQFLVRLEDTDRSPERYVPEGVYEIEYSLRQLGILPDEWWVTGGPKGPYVQSERLPLYQEVTERLIAEGNAYRCYCTKERLDAVRAEQSAEKKPTGYDRHCRKPENAEAMRLERVARGEENPSYVVRLAMPTEGVTVLHDVVRGEIRYENSSQDDQVLLKSDGFPTYFLACTVDDHEMGITHILRGDDWLGSAPKMVKLYDFLGWTPPAFCHLPLIVGTDKKKLSKRHGSTQFTWFLEEGYLPEALFNFLVLLGWSPGSEDRELFSIPELIERFSLKGISESPAVFDYEKLKWMNGQYIRASEQGRIIGMCLPYLRRAGLIPDAPVQAEGEAEKAFEGRKEQYRVEVLDYVRRVIPLEIERIKVLSEIVNVVGFFFQELDYPTGYDEKAVKKWLGVEHLKPLLEKEIAAFEALPAWTPEALEAAGHSLAEEMELPLAQIIHPTRVAATGRTTGPGLWETLWALGRDRTLRRLRTVLEKN